MRTLTLPVIAVLFTRLLIAQAPVPSAVVNPASNIPAGLPSSGIAQGSIFVVYGTKMGPAALAQAPAFPLPTTAGLGGTVVTVTIGSTTVTAPIVYTVATQVAAVLPSATPIGTGTLTINYNGQIGTTPITVVASNFGISTLNETGGGPAVVTRPDYSVITLTNSAKPGETLVLWGTGLGAIAGSDAGVPTSVDLGTPIQIFLGGQTAQVTYRGRSGFPGLDQINFVVPSNIGTGCYVPIVVQTNTMVSNVPTLPIATTGGTCTDTTGIPISDLTSVLNSGTVRFAAISMDQTTATSPGIGPLPPTTSTTASASAVFYKFTSAQFTSSGSITGQPSVGGCTVTYITPQVGSVAPFSGTGLNAGTTIAVNGPQTFTMTPVPSLAGFYSSTLKNGLTAGTYVANNGSGGADVGGFTVSLNVAAPLTWTNQAAAATVDRTQAFTVTWTGGDPAGYVTITGTSVIATSSAYGATFACTAPVAAGKFTIPAPILLSLPPSQVFTTGGFSIPTGNMALASYGAFQRFNAPGIDFGYALAGGLSDLTMTYK